MNTFSYKFGTSGLSYLTSPSHSAYNFGKGDFSIEAWVKTFHGGPIMARKVTDGGPSHGGFFLTLEMHAIVFTSDDGSYWNSLRGTADVCDGRWHHVAAVRSGTTGFLYLDGVQVPATGSGNAFPPLNVNSTDRLTIGTVDQTTQPNRFFRGMLAEIRLWNTARTAAQVLGNRNYRLSPVGLGSDLVGYWPAEFGFALDFSNTRNTTTASGPNPGSGECPPLTSPEFETLSSIFHGIYDAATKPASGGGNWSSGRSLALTTQGFVVVNGNTVIRGAQIQGIQIKWSAAGNPFEADIEFMNWSTTPNYWPTRESRPLFEGTMKEGSGAPQLYKGWLAPIRVGCGWVLNIGTGLVLSCPNPGVGSAVTLVPKDPHSHDHFCRYDSATILHMDSGLALKPANADAAGSRIFLTTPSPGGAKSSWSFEPNGTIVLKAKPSLGLAADSSQLAPILANVNPSDEKQQWLSPQGSQVIFNGSGSVMSGSQSGPVIAQKTDGAPEQLWYTFRSAILCGSTAQALTTSVGAGVGTTLSLARWSPSDTKQQFLIQGGQIKHTASGLIVVANLSTKKLVLASAQTTGTAAQWSLSTPVGAASAKAEEHLRAKRETVSTSATATYSVSISTGDYIAAGTDDRVEISLQSKDTTLPFQILDHNTTNTDPFERGHTDTFRLEGLQNIGTVKYVTIRYGGNNWLWNERWVVDQMVVVNETEHMVSTFSTFGYGYTAQFEMPSVASFAAVNYRYIQIANCKMALGMAPAQDAIGARFGWYHTWISVLNTEGPPVKTWFDCAGGHEGPGTINDVVTGLCDRQQVVRMSTGRPYDAQHPLREAYGTNRTDGVDNANVRADGKVKWDGQCHQIANRYLWTCIPSKTIASAPYANQPPGYGLSSCAFGTYGVGFDDWCIKCGFERQAGQSDDNLLTWVQLLVPVVEKARDIRNWILRFRNDINTASDPAPDGPEVRKLLTTLKNRGNTVPEMAKLTNLTEAKINQILA